MNNENVKPALGTCACDEPKTCVKAQEEVLRDLQYELIFISEKLICLRNFIAKPEALEKLGRKQAELLQKQEVYMSGYAGILRQRIGEILPIDEELE